MVNVDWQKLVDKCLSGRFILTVLCGLTFTYVSIKGMIDPPAVMTIISSVFTAYFGRSDRKLPTQGQGG